MRYLCFMALLLLVRPCYGQPAGGILFASVLDDDCKADLEMAHDALTAVSAGLRTGYIAGWLDATEGVETTWNGTRYNVHFDEGITVKQMRLVFQKYLHAHPEELNKKASFVLAEAAFDAKLLYWQPYVENVAH